MQEQKDLNRCMHTNAWDKMTKIQITEKEFYSIEIPEVMNREKLDYILGRLLFVQKMMGKDQLIEATQKSNFKDQTYAKPKMKNVHHGEFLKSLRADRNLAVELYTAYYSKDKKSAIEAFAKKYGQEDYLPGRAISGKPFNQIRNSHNITPQEVGLIEFPGRGRNIKIRRLQNKDDTNN